MISFTVRVTRVTTYEVEAENSDYALNAALGNTWSGARKHAGIPQVMDEQTVDAQVEPVADDDNDKLDRGFGLCPDCGYGYFNEYSRPCSEVLGAGGLS